ncbi:DUF2510 domain-containing protein [Galbitalea soli]|uniref:DUF2510 domain-containing protein n=1 Tax=Galbitalea soli TaxID=1268042 RepID=A0A7C9PNG8_9MICO|nr:DUF2510 domain-containing protein [Galbitalea soli]NEM91693.1 DUF2510 domain-containing protein [Galbitalea soli]NYJ30389.1 hypothetical protein [Galbitalea soli]
MSDATDDLPPMGWYADPRVPRQLRWWDGQGWTNNVYMPDSNAPQWNADGDAAGRDSGSKWDFPQPA